MEVRKYMQRKQRLTGNNIHFEAGIARALLKYMSM